MRTITYFTEDNEMVTVDIIEVEASDIDRREDELITFVEANGGCWYLFRLPDGSVVGFFKEDE